MTDVHAVARDQLLAFITRIERLEEEKKTIADDIKDVKAEAKGCGFDVGTINAIIKLRKVDADERAERDALLDTYLIALGMLPEPAGYDEPHQSAPVERQPSMALRSDGGLSIFTKHEDIRTSDGSPSVSSSLATREPEESVVPHSPATAAVPSSEQSEGNGLRDHQHVHSRQTDEAKHGGQDGEPAGADHATHLPDTANEVPAQDGGGTALGESHGDKSNAARPASVDAHVNDGRLAGEVSAEVVTVVGTESGTVATPKVLDGGSPVAGESRHHCDVSEDGAGQTFTGNPTSNTGEGAANTALPAKSSIRPLCRNPGEACGGYGRKHCRACEAAGAELEAAE